MIVFPLKQSENKVTNTIFFNVTVDACVILNWKLGRGSLSSVEDFFIFSHSSLCFLVNVLIFDLQSTDDLMSPFNGLLENSRVSYHFLRFIFFFFVHFCLKRLTVYTIIRRVFVTITRGIPIWVKKTRRDCFFVSLFSSFSLSLERFRF